MIQAEHRCKKARARRARWAQKSRSEAALVGVFGAYLQEPGRYFWIVVVLPVHFHSAIALP